MDGLKIIAANLHRIEVVSESMGPSIYLDIGQDPLVPLTVSGEGMVRMFSIILELISSRNGVLLIDEIDNGLHHTAMPKLWKLLGALVEKHDVQIFATTHNDDMMVVGACSRSPERRACSDSLASTSGANATSWLFQRGGDEGNPRGSLRGVG